VVALFGYCTKVVMMGVNVETACVSRSCEGIGEATIIVVCDSRYRDAFCVCGNWQQSKLLYQDNMVRLTMIMSFSVDRQEREAVSNFAMTGLSINAVTKCLATRTHFRRNAKQEVWP
jgi:hypothetical protein